MDGFDVLINDIKPLFLFIGQRLIQLLKCGPYDFDRLQHRLDPGPHYGEPARWRARKLGWASVLKNTDGLGRRCLHLVKQGFLLLARRNLARYSLNREMDERFRLTQADLGLVPGSRAVVRNIILGRIPAVDTREDIVVGTRPK